MSQVGISATATDEGIVLVYSTAENGEEYRLTCTPEAYVDFVRAQIAALLPYPTLMAALFGYGGE